MNLNPEEHTRDYIGYAGKPPHPEWPNNAKLAVSFVINYEEGGEYSIPQGDRHTDTYLSEIIFPPEPVLDRRVFAAESIFEYGARSGIWRLIDNFNQRDVKPTVWVVGRAAEVNSHTVKKMADSGFEIASHHYRFYDYWDMDEVEEREHIQKAVSSVEAATGKRPVGFYGGRTSINTRRLVIEEGGFLYESDAYNDELPYWISVEGKPQLIVPYMLDNNDFRYSVNPTFPTGDDFYNYNKATFDFLYREGATSPKMMTIALHGRLSGRPGRAEALFRLVDYIQSHDDVWICTREQIARHWRERFPFNAAN